MRIFKLVYLLHDAGTRLEFILEHAAQAVGRGHRVRVLGPGSPPSWWRAAYLHETTHLPEIDRLDADFVIACGAASLERAVDVGGALPLHFISRPPIVNVADGRAIDAALRLPTFKITNSTRTQRVLYQRYQSRCWFVPDGVSVPTRGSHSERAPDQPWRILLIGSNAEPGLASAAALRRSGIAVEFFRLAHGLPDPAEQASGHVDRWLGGASPDARRAVFHNTDILLALNGESDDYYLAIEAMSHGVCVVLSDTPGHHSFGPGTDYAMFVPPDDAISVTHAVSDLITNAGLRARIVDAGRRASRRMGWDEHFARLDSVLLEISSSYADAYALNRTVSPHAPLRSFETIVLDHQVDFAGSLVSDRAVTVVGVGRNGVASELAKRGADAVAAFASSEVALAYARRHHAHPRVHYRLWDPHAATLEATDVVVALDPAAYGIDCGHLITTAARSLRPGGALLLSACGRSGFDERDEDPSLEFSKETWLERWLPTLNAHFEKVIVLGQSAVDGELVIGPEVASPPCLAYVLLAVHPTFARPPTERVAEDVRNDAEPPTPLPRRSESRRRRRAA